LRFAAWITWETAKKIVEATGKDFDLLLRRAELKDFRPVDLGARVAVDMRSRVRRFRSPNVIARLDGADSVGRAEAVLVTAHYDHLGVGRAEAGDSIFNGAVDNASGLGVLLGAAAALSQSPRPPRRSILFAAWTASEAGSLGAGAYLADPSVPLNRTVAVLNLDRGNAWGPTRDIAALGADLSTLAERVGEAARAEGLQLVGDAEAQQGDFYRSDHLVFARAGVPVVLLKPGPTYAERDTAWGRAQWTAYREGRFHRPSDGVTPEFDYRGLVQQARVLTMLTWSLASGADYPEWRAGTEFRAAGQRLRRP
jgi:Zn-dependent M28 family amino/carboxypeptidase